MTTTPPSPSEGSPFDVDFSSFDDYDDDVEAILAFEEELREADRQGEPGDPFALPAHLVDANDRIKAPLPEGDLGSRLQSSDGNGLTTHAVRVFRPSDAAARLQERGEGSPFGGRDRVEQVIASMSDDPLRGFRSLTVGTPEMIAAVEALEAAMPNFATPLRYIRLAVTASHHAKVPISLEPLILVGEPGTGKTRVVQKLAQILSVPFERVSMSILSGAQPLTGTDETWRTSRPGKVAKALIESDCANPLFLLDEIDKAYRSSAQEDLLDPLHDLWEPENSRCFRDDALQIPLHAAHVIWMATANDITAIRPSLLDRARVIEIGTPDAEAMRVIIRAIYAELADTWGGWFEPSLAAPVLDMIAKLHPRRARQVMQGAMRHAAAHQRREIGQADLDAAMGEGVTSRPFRLGFI